MVHLFRLLSSLVIGALLMASSVLAQQGGTTRYVYDDNGRLRAVIAPNGEANVYEYDPAGNITAIRRNAATTLEVLDFSPREGVPGTQVTIVGTGFGVGVNSVTFNGVAAQIASVNGPQIIVAVPLAATTGPIVVSTSTTNAETANPFIVRGIAISPPAAVLQSDESLQLTASVISSEGQGVVWSVAGIEGGASTVGTITSNGLYLAPRLASGQASAALRIQAKSATAPDLFGEAIITVQNPEVLPPLAARAVSVRNGSLPGDAPIYAGVISVRNGNPPEDASVFSRNISVTQDPIIAAIQPLQAIRGAATSITISGANLAGINLITAIDLTNSIPDTSITISNISVNPAGTTLTAMFTISGTAVLGRRVLILSASGRSSQSIDTGVNTLEVIP